MTGAADFSAPRSRPAQLSEAALHTDAAIFHFGFDFSKGAALFRRIDASVPPEGCAGAERWPGYAMPIDNLLSLHLDARLADAKPIAFVWMTDFCLSSLYAKALFALDGFYLYNENSVLAQVAMLKRAVADGASRCPPETFRRLLRTSLFLQSRTFAEHDMALVKEWPHSNLVLRETLAADSRYRGVFLYGSLEEYLGKALAHPGRSRLARLRVMEVFSEMRAMPEFEGVDYAHLSDPAAAALHWLYLMYRLKLDLAALGPGMLRTLDNRRLVEDPAGVLATSAEFYGRPASRQAVEAVVSGPVFATHSKAGGAFDFADHERNIAESRARLAPAIEQGLAYAAPILRRFPLPDLAAYAL